jgi:hypothetical protein
MSEIYRDATDAEVSLNITGAAVTEVEFTRDGVVLGSTGSATPALVPYAVTYSDGPFRVKWTYSVGATTYTREEEHDVVTPLFSAAELRAFNASFETLTDAKIVELESIVRKIIEGAVGQRFGYRKGTKTIYGSDKPALRVGERVISVDPLDGYGDLRIINNGFGVTRAGWTWNGDTISIAGPIRDARFGRRTDIFGRNMPYVISGEFGWLSVPNDVKQAALLLAEEFSCKEAAWRDRYLIAISASDWRFQFDPQAFAGTGSVTVDRLLEPYAVGTIAII